MAQTPKRAAIYARVSTTDKGQDTENQLPRLREWCAAMGYEVAAEYEEQQSGGKGITGREQFAQLLTDASQRKFDLLIFWSLDRFSREGLAVTITYLERLNSYGVAFHSYTEPYLSTDNEFARDILLSVLASLAKLQRRKISENTKAGLERKGRQGTWRLKAIE